GYAPTNMTVQLRNPQPPPDSLNLGRGVLDSFQSQVPVAAPPARLFGNVGSSQRFAPPPQQDKQFAGYAAPTVAQLRQLADHDVVIVVDKSGSMGTPDCPADAPTTIRNIFMSVAGFGGGGFIGAIPRWEWCRRQTMHVASLLGQVPGSKLKLVL